MAGGKGYAKLFRRIWSDEKFLKLDSIGKLVAIYALTSQSNRIGLFRFSRALAAEELGLSRDRLDTVWGTVYHTLSWGWDEGVSVVWIPSWWKWNPPDNESALRGYLSDLDEVPTCSLIAKFGNNLRHLPDTLHPTVSHTVSYRVGDTVSPPEPEPEPEKEPEPKPEKQRARRAPPALEISPAQIAAVATRFAMPIPEVELLAERVIAEAPQRGYRNAYSALLNWAKREASNGKTHPGPSRALSATEQLIIDAGGKL